MVPALVSVWTFLVHHLGDMKVIALLLKCLRSAVRRMSGIFHRRAMMSLSTVDAPDSCFVGREGDMGTLAKTLAASNYVVIHGAGGCGKSELVKQYVALSTKNYPGGCFQVDSAELSKWKDVFLGLERRSTKHGVSAARIIGYNGCRKFEDERKDSDSALERWQLIRDNILSSARNRGAVLLFLDNVDDVGSLLSSAALRDAFQSGFSGDVKVKIVVTARQMTSQVDENVEDLSLQDLPTDSALKVLREGCSRALTPAEEQSAKRIVMMLGGRALYMRRLPSLLNNEFTERAYTSYVEIERDLNGRRDEILKDLCDSRCLPKCLWKMTCESLSRILRKGDKCIRLAGIVSSLPKNGGDDDLIRWLWERLIEGRETFDVSQPNEELRQAKRILERFHVLTTVTSFRMHPLDRDAVYESMCDAEPAFMDQVAQELSGYIGVSDRFWYFMSDRPRIVRMVDISSVSNRLAIILLQQSPEFEEKVNWAQFTGADWVRLLRACPEYAARCDWTKIKPDGWVRLLMRRPEFESLCPFDSFSGHNWASLICEQSRFWVRVDKKSLSDNDWAQIVAVKPHFLSKCPAGLRTLQFYSRLIALNPSFYKLAPHKKFRGGDWARVLSAQPQFAQDCDWKRLGSANIYRLLSVHPEFADLCDLSKLTSKRWNKLVRRQPEKLKRYNLHSLSRETWSYLISLDIHYAESAPSLEFSPKVWVRMLLDNPALVKMCPFNQFDGESWCCLLLAKPRYVHRCDWQKLSQADRDRLIKGNPRFKSYIASLKTDDR